MKRVSPVVVLAIAVCAGALVVLLVPDRFLSAPSSFEGVTVRDLQAQGLSPSEARQLALQTEAQQQASADRRRTLLASFFAAFAVLGGAWVAYGNVRVARRNLELLNEGQQNAVAQLQLATSDQINQRFRDAIEQLGHESMAVRLGGVYSLANLGDDHSERRKDVFEILSSFVRFRSVDRSPAQIDPPADVVAALRHLASRDGSQAECPVDLSGANLFGADLTDARFSGAVLRGTVLAGAVLDGADLSDADLARACLYGASAEGANFAESTLASADLQLFDFKRGWHHGRSQPVFKRANLYGAFLPFADFAGVDLTGANLYSCLARHANFSAATLTGVNATSADLAGSTLEEAVLQKTSLGGAILLSADLLRADCTEAFFGSADLRNARLAFAQVDKTQTKSAVWSTRTIWPSNDFEPPESSPSDDDESRVETRPLGASVLLYPLADETLDAVNRRILERFHHLLAMMSAMAATLRSSIPNFDEVDPAPLSDEEADKLNAAAGTSELTLNLDARQMRFLYEALVEAIEPDLSWLTPRLRAPVGTRRDAVDD